MHVCNKCKFKLKKKNQKRNESEKSKVIQSNAAVLRSSRRWHWQLFATTLPHGHYYLCIMSCKWHFMNFLHIYTHIYKVWHLLPFTVATTKQVCWLLTMAMLVCMCGAERWTSNAKISSLIINCAGKSRHALNDCNHQVGHQHSRTLTQRQCHSSCRKNWQLSFTNEMLYFSIF